MDVGKGALCYSIILVVFFVCFLGSLAALYVRKFGATARGGPTLLAIAMFRPFNPYLFTFDQGNTSDPQDKTYRKGKGLHPNLPYYQITCGALMLFLFLWSKSIILIFLFKCKLLVNSFGIWNGRVYATVLRGREYNYTEAGRSAYKILFKVYNFL